MLATFFAAFVEKLLSILGDDVMAWYQKRKAAAAAQALTDAAALTSVQALKDAKTGEDVDKATDSTLSGS